MSTSDSIRWQPAMVVVACAMTLAVCCSAALACAQSVQGSSAQGKRITSDKGARTTVSDPDDFYFFDGKRIQLDRSLVECVVSFKPQAEIIGEKILREITRSGTLGGEIRSEGRTFHIVTIPVDAGLSLQRLMTQLRAKKNDVQFVAPVFYEPATRRRVLPTDQIVVKLKPEGTRQDLTRFVATRGLIVLEPVRDTKNQYVLRLADPRKGDAIERSRALHESGRFEWAQPDFVQESRRRMGPVPGRSQN